MKLSSRKELLNEADQILAEIHNNITRRKVNEVDWEKHEKWTEDEDEKKRQYRINRMAAFYLDKKGREIYKKYEKSEKMGEPFSLRRQNITKRKEKELKQLSDMVKTIKDHLLQQKVKIPRDPTKQTELQKILVNHPIVTPEDVTN